MNPFPRRGFTLVEVMIALAVFALAAVVLGSAYVNVLNAYEQVGDAAARDEDLRFARQAILLEADREKVEDGGDFQSVDGRQVRWEAQIEPTETADLFEVTFTCEIAASSDAEARRYEQRFRVLRPTWSEGTDREKLRSESAKRIAELQRVRFGDRR